jgi:ABC-type multidrug transport system fused ATPase/permease subunit
MGAGELINPQIIRTPLLMLPLILSSLSSALVAVNRISRFLTAEELPDPYLINKSLEAAVIVDGDFTWEKAEISRVDQGAEQGKETASNADKGKKKQAKKEKIGKKGKTILPTTAAEKSEGPPGEELKDDDNPFELKNLKINIPKGSFVAIVGQVGSGKVIVMMTHNFPELSHLLELCSPILDWGDASDKG